jgi:hypothetical protein
LGDVFPLVEVLSHVMLIAWFLVCFWLSLDDTLLPFIVEFGARESATK